MPEVFGIKIAGPAGSGIMSAGETLYRTFVKSGYYCQGYPEYPSLIKGGHNTYLVTLSEDPFPNNAPKIDLLLVLTQIALENEHTNIDEETNIIADATLKADHTHKLLFQPALLEIARNVGNPLILNTVMIGFASAQLRLDADLVWEIIKGELGEKSQTLIDQNKTAFDQALTLSSQSHLSLALPKPKNNDSQLILNGGQATGLGAIAAGVNLYAGYPMTPSSPLLHFMAAHQTEFNYLVRQTEDEISAINLVIGASFAGAKSMTGTSGGGFALMVEGLSLAGMVETPIVIYLAMRPGPATGLPTWTSQSDLLFAINAGHGEFPRVVLAPGDPLECYSLTHQAFSLSQAFHIPVIILSDKYLAENNYCLKQLSTLEPVSLDFVSPTPKADEMFARYQYTNNGVHGRTIPGLPQGEYIANSDEHGETGLVDETAPTREHNNQRRHQKMVEIKKIIPLPEVAGAGDSAIISWGSQKYIARAVASQLGFAHVHFNYLWPMPDGLNKVLTNYKQLITIENNQTHQLAHLIRQETGLLVHLQLGDDSGRPLDPSKLITQIGNAKP
jgi:2-oxoglutarate ferredoxin oxidoreductase subunit alpha